MATREFVPPPDFSVVDDNDGNNNGDENDDDDNDRVENVPTRLPKKDLLAASEADYEETPRQKNSIKRPRRMALGNQASWMERNAEFLPEETATTTSTEPASSTRASPPRSSWGAPRPSFRSNDDDDDDNDGRKNKTFRRDFRGTRVFVQGLPPDASWQDVKDHFREAGAVVFASVSVDPRTGESRGHGIVQYETTEMAQTAIAIMRDYPMNGYKLFVREDVQEGKAGAELKSRAPPREARNTPPAQWTCADKENAEYLDETDRMTVLNLIRARDDARRRRQYDASDAMRTELKVKFGVHLDDRLKMWWTSMDGKQVPQVLKEINGEGRWGLKLWRQIPTTPENDACVNPDLEQALLNQRDIARREKDFSTADALLEEARTSPDGDLYLRIHDESRTWRIWTDAPPPRPVSHGKKELSPAEHCMAIVEEFAPEKVEEVRLVLEKFPGREWQVLKKLRQRYMQQ